MKNAIRLFQPLRPDGKYPLSGFPDFSLFEQRLLLLLVSKQSIVGNKDRILLDIHDLEVCLKQEKSHYKNYSSMAREFINHASFLIEIPSEIHEEIVPLFSSFLIHEKTEVLISIFHPRAFSFLLDIFSMWDSSTLEIVFSLQGRYSKILFELLKDKQHFGTVCIDAPLFLTLFEVPYSYRPVHIEKYILTPALEQLSSVFKGLSSSLLMDGRIVTQYRFDFRPILPSSIKPVVQAAIQIVGEDLLLNEDYSYTGDDFIVLLELIEKYSLPQFEKGYSFYKELRSKKVLIPNRWEFIENLLQR